jgi:Protein of unknown function (DUF2946)
MDDIVKQAMAKWPKVPACVGWLGLDARGQWWMRDDGAQAAGSFTSGAPKSKGAVLQHGKLIAFIERNYGVEAAGDMAGCWFFQNGPQRVYVELEAAPWIIRLQPDGAAHSHIGATLQLQQCFCDEHGRAYFQTDQGLGLVHTQDVAMLADWLDAGRFSVAQIASRTLAQRFHFEFSPESKKAAQ